MQWTTVRDASLAAGFLLAVFAPAIDQITRDDEARGPEPERREAASAPEFPPRSLKAALRLPVEWEPHYMDTFGLRDRLLRARSRLHWFGMGLSPTANIAKGSEGWVYTRVNQSREAWRGTLPMTSAELRLWTSALEQRRAWLESLGIRYLYVVAPNKETIYPEHVPADWRPVAPNAPSRLDQLLTAMQGEQVDILDLRPALHAARALDRPGDEVYTRLGSHWNGHGSRAAYEAIMESVRASFPETRTLGDTELVRLYNVGRGDSWGSHLYIDDLLLQREWLLVHQGGPRHELLVSGGDRTGPSRSQKLGQPGPRIMVFHDSFGPYIQGALAESFPKASFHWQPRFDPSDVLAERPELVIDFYVERALTRVDHLKAIDYSLFEGRLVGKERQRIVWCTDASPPLSEPGSQPLAREGEGGFLATIDERKLGVRLPTLPVGVGRQFELLIEGAIAEESMLDVYCRDEGAKEFKRADRITLQLQGGDFRKLVLFPPGAERREVVLRWSGKAPLSLKYVEARLRP